MNYRRLAPVLVFAGLLTPATFGQTRTTEPVDDSQIRQMLINQPDYAAILKFALVEVKGGFGATSKVAKLGRRLREENDDSIFIKESGKPTIKIYPKRRELAEIPAEAKGDEEFAVTPEELAKRPDVDFKFIGTEKIGAYDCRKIEAGYRVERLRELKFVFCLANGLHNLVIFEQASFGKVTMTKILSNVSLSVSPELFRIPAGYKRVVEKSYAEQSQELIDLIKASPSPKPS